MARQTLMDFASEGSLMERVAESGIVEDWLALAGEIEEATRESAEVTSIDYCFELENMALWFRKIGMPDVLPWAKHVKNQ
jgi:hypothetical protein